MKAAVSSVETLRGRKHSKKVPPAHKGGLLKKPTSCHSESECRNASEQDNAVVHCSDTKAHPDHSSQLVRLRRIQGQLAGIERMITERRYCVDILIQFGAVSAALKSIEAGVFESHLRSCVQSAMTSKNPKEVDAKIDELMKLFLKR